MKKTSFALGVLVGILVALAGFLAFRHNQLQDSLELRQLESESMKKRLEVIKEPQPAVQKAETSQAQASSPK
jgi:hypothetical protein